MALAAISQASTNAIDWSISKSSQTSTQLLPEKKEIKGWRREKKNKLVESMNPEWKDLAADWYPDGLLKDGKPFNPQ
jgi:predicted GIY-YIG superfamily endonuclease